MGSPRPQGFESSSPEAEEKAWTGSSRRRIRDSKWGIEKYGVLRLDLAAGSYAWEYVDITGAVLDSGGPVPCHG